MFSLITFELLAGIALVAIGLAILFAVITIAMFCAYWSGEMHGFNRRHVEQLERELSDEEWEPTRNE